MRGQLDENLSSARARQSQLEDVDLAEAIIEATTAEHAQEAALAMASRLDQPSLLDYLR
jgi:flagellin-like hook-associated protein FlgL